MKSTILSLVLLLPISNAFAQFNHCNPKIVGPNCGYVATESATTTQSVSLGDYLTEKSSVGVNSVSLLTAAYMIYEAVNNFKAKDPMSGLTSAALGASTALGAITIVTQVNAEEYNEEKVVNEIMNSDQYLEIENHYGEEKAREFLLDVLAGWSIEKLDEKYNITEEDVQASSNVNDSSRAVAQEAVSSQGSAQTINKAAGR